MGKTIIYLIMILILSTSCFALINITYRLNPYTAKNDMLTASSQMDETFKFKTICINGNCRTSWPSGGGGGASYQYQKPWLYNLSDLVYFNQSYLNKQGYIKNGSDVKFRKVNVTDSVIIYNNLTLATSASPYWLYHGVIPESGRLGLQTNSEFEISIFNESSLWLTDYAGARTLARFNNFSSYIAYGNFGVGTFNPQEKFVVSTPNRDPAVVVKETSYNDDITYYQGYLGIYGASGQPESYIEGGNIYSSSISAGQVYATTVRTVNLDGSNGDLNVKAATLGDHVNLGSSTTNSLTTGYWLGTIMYVENGKKFSLNKTTSRFYQNLRIDDNLSVDRIIFNGVARTSWPSGSSKYNSSLWYLKNSQITSNGTKGNVNITGNLTITNPKGNTVTINNFVEHVQEMMTDTLLDKSRPTIKVVNGKLNYTLIAYYGCGQFNFNATLYPKDHSCVKNASINLLAGTNSTPKTNYVHFKLVGNMPTLMTTETYPSYTHIDVATFVVGNVSSTKANVYSYSRNRYEVDSFVKRVIERFEESGTLYTGGFTPTVNLTNINLTSGGAFFNGIFEMTSTNSISLMRDGFYFINGTGKFRQNNTLNVFTRYSDGNLFSGGPNERVNIVWGVVPVNTTGGTGPTQMRLVAVIANEPIVKYTSLNDAISDNYDTTNYYPPNTEIKNVFTPIIRTIMRVSTKKLEPFSTGLYYQDIRGKITSGGGSSATVDTTSFLRKDGTVALTGDWNTGAFIINNTKAILTNNITFKTGIFTLNDGSDPFFTCGQNDQCNITDKWRFAKNITIIDRITTKALNVTKVAYINITRYGASCIFRNDTALRIESVCTR